MPDQTNTAEAVERLRAECAGSNFHDHDGCSCSDAELLTRDSRRVRAAETSAPIATPEEVAAAINILSRASGLGFTVHAALDIVLPALASYKAEIERLKERLRSAEATVDTFMRAQEHYREAMDERNTFKNAARAAEAQVAALTEQVRKLREALEDQPEAGDDDFYQLGWRHAMERCRAALSPTEPDAMEK